MVVVESVLLPAAAAVVSLAKSVAAVLLLLPTNTVVLEVTTLIGVGLLETLSVVAVAAVVESVATD